MKMRVFQGFLVYLGSWRADELLTLVGTALVLGPMVNLFVSVLVWAGGNKTPKI